MTSEKSFCGYNAFLLGRPICLNMSIFSENKFWLGVAGAAASAAFAGFLVGKRCESKVIKTEDLILKSHLKGAERNPIVKYLVENSLQEPEPLRKLREVSSLLLILRDLLEAAIRRAHTVNIFGRLIWDCRTWRWCVCLYGHFAKCRMNPEYMSVLPKATLA